MVYIVIYSLGILVTQAEVPITSFCFSRSQDPHTASSLIPPIGITPSALLNNPANHPQRLGWANNLQNEVFSPACFQFSPLWRTKGSPHFSTFNCHLQEQPQSLSLFLLNYKLLSHPSKETYLSVVDNKPWEPSRLRSEVKFKWDTSTIWPNFNPAKKFKGKKLSKFLKKLSPSFNLQLKLIYFENMPCFSPFFFSSLRNASVISQPKCSFHFLKAKYLMWFTFHCLMFVSW